MKTWRGGGGLLKKKRFLDTKKTLCGHQFKGHVIQIAETDALHLHAAQSIIDILVHPIWWSGVGHGAVAFAL